MRTPLSMCRFAAQYDFFNLIGHSKPASNVRTPRRPFGNLAQPQRSSHVRRTFSCIAQPHILRQRSSFASSGHHSSSPTPPHDHQRRHYSSYSPPQQYSPPPPPSPQHPSTSTSATGDRPVLNLRRVNLVPISAKQLRATQKAAEWRKEMEVRRAGHRPAWFLARMLISNPEAEEMFRRWDKEAKEKVLEWMTKAEWRRVKEVYGPNWREKRYCPLEEFERRKLRDMLQPVFATQSKEGAKHEVAGGKEGAKFKSAGGKKATQGARESQGPVRNLINWE